MNWLKKFLQMLWEAFKKANEGDLIPIPNPPEPPKPPDPPQDPVKLIVFDIELIAEEMFATGGVPRVRQNVYNYGLSCELSGYAWSLADAEIEALWNVRDRVLAYGEGKIKTAYDKLKANPQATATIVINDRRDGFGCRIAPEVKNRLAEFGDRVQLGTIVPESEY